MFIRLSVNHREHPPIGFLCFKHAAKLAQAGFEIEMTVEEEASQQCCPICKPTRHYFEIDSEGFWLHFK